MKANEGKKDAFGLPSPDAATFASLRNEALTARPKASHWADLVASLRWAVEVDRGDSEDDPNFPAGTTAPRLALNAVIAFLSKQDCAERHGAVVPLIRLSGALADLGNGVTSPLFKKVGRKPGKPIKGHAEAMTMGFAARIVTELMGSGVSLLDATRQVATALRGARVRGWRRINAETVKNWRARIKEGADGAPQDAIDHYNAPLPAALGSTPKQRAETMLKILRERARGAGG